MQENGRRRKEELQEGRGSQGEGCQSRRQGRLRQSQGRCQGDEKSSVTTAFVTKIRGALRPLFFCSIPPRPSASSPLAIAGSGHSRRQGSSRCLGRRSGITETG